MVGNFHRRGLIKNCGLRPAMNEKAYFAFAVSYLEVRVYGQIATTKKRFSERISKHECSKAHMNNCVSLQILGKVNILSAIDAGYRRSIIKHNKLVDRNRHALNRITNCIKFCGFYELPLRGHDEVKGSANRGVFLDLVMYTADLKI